MAGSELFVITEFDCIRHKMGESTKMKTTEKTSLKINDLASTVFSSLIQNGKQGSGGLTLKDY